MHIVISNSSDLPIYAQIKEQVKEQEGFITSRQGKGFFVMSSGSDLIREQLIRDVELNLTRAIQSAGRAAMTNDEIISLLRLLLEVEND